MNNLSEICRNIWLLNGIMAGGLMVVIQLIAMIGVLAKMFEKKK